MKLLNETTQDAKDRRNDISKVTLVISPMHAPNRASTSLIGDDDKLIFVH